jgi:NtrC-family two-component system sensor histidine kinase KinB
MTGEAYLQLKFTSISPGKLAELAYAPFRNQFADKDISVEFNIPYVLPALQCDVAKIAWVLTIFFSNAVRYTPQWGKLVVKGSDAQGNVRLAVENSGYGIPPERLGQMFEAAENPDAPEFGRGLALLLARDIVEAHGGKIGVYTEPGVLTGFFMELPIIRTEAE